MTKTHESIKAIRLLAGVSQAQAAKRIYVRREAYNMKENGRTKGGFSPLEFDVLIKFFEEKIYERKSDNK